MVFEFTCWAAGRRISLWTLLAPLLLCWLWSIESKAAFAHSRLAINYKPEKSHELIILSVDKSRLRADLMTWPSHVKDSRILMSFRIAIGKQEGDKQKEGDGKTPEGIYFTKAIIGGRTLPSKYGAMAIPINFPNPMDRFRRKTGYGIWLHGVENDQRIEAAKVTEGCVAFYNSDIRQLTNWLRPRQGIVVISDRNENTNQTADLDALRLNHESWLASWKTQKLHEYLNHYHPKFRYKKMNRKGFKNYKKRIFARYRQIELTASKVRFFTHKKYGLTLMNQDFNGDNSYISRGRKVVYWVKDNSGQWKILHEHFSKRRIDFMTFSDQEIALKFANSPSWKGLNKLHESSRL